MPKKILAQALVKKVGYSKCRAEKLVDTVLGLVKKGLGEGKSIDLGRLGVLETVTRKPTRKIVRLKHLVPTIITINKHKKSVKLRSNLDLSTEEEKVASKAAISGCRLPDEDHETPNPPISRSCSIASVSWRSRAYRVPSRTKQFRNK